MFKETKHRIFSSFSEQEKEFFEDKINEIKKLDRFIATPGIEFATKTGKNALIIATKGIPFKSENDNYYPQKPIAISYDDFGNEFVLSKIVELTEDEFRELFLCYKL